MTEDISQVNKALKRALNELNEALTKAISELKKALNELNKTVNKGIKSLTRLRRGLLRWLFIRFRRLLISFIRLLFTCEISSVTSTAPLLPALVFDARLVLELRKNTSCPSRRSYSSAASHLPLGGLLPMARGPNTTVDGIIDPRVNKALFTVLYNVL